MTDEESGYRESIPPRDSAKIRANMHALEMQYHREGFTPAREKVLFREMKKLSQELKVAKKFTSLTINEKMDLIRKYGFDGRTRDGAENGAMEEFRLAANSRMNVKQYYASVPELLAGFDGRTGFSAKQELYIAESRGLNAEQYYASVPDLIAKFNVVKNEEELARKEFDEMWERMKQNSPKDVLPTAEDNEIEIEDEVVAGVRCSACKAPLPCNCGVVDDSDNIARKPRFGSHEP